MSLCVCVVFSISVLISFFISFFMSSLTVTLISLTNSSFSFYKICTFNNFTNSFLDIIHFFIYSRLSYIKCRSISPVKSPVVSPVMPVAPWGVWSELLVRSFLRSIQLWFLTAVDANLMFNGTSSFFIAC